MQQRHSWKSHRKFIPCLCYDKPAKHFEYMNKLSKQTIRPKSVGQPTYIKLRLRCLAIPAQGLCGEKAITVTCLALQGRLGLLYRKLRYFPDVNSLRSVSALFFS